MRRVRLFLCDHKHTGTSSEKRSAAKKKRKCTERLIRTAHRIPIRKRMPARIRHPISCIKRIRPGGVPHSGSCTSVDPAGRFLYLCVLFTSNPLESPQKPAHKRSFFSEEQEEAVNGCQNDFRHLLPALQFAQERSCVFFNRRGARVHQSAQKKSGPTMTGIQCPYCRSSLALDRIGVHFQKFCSKLPTEAAREISMKKYNQFYTFLQSHSRGEITVEELQSEANKLFAPGR